MYHVDDKGCNARVVIWRFTPFYLHDVMVARDPKFDPVGGMQVQIARVSEALAQNGICQKIITIGHPGVPRIYKTQQTLEVNSVRLTMPVIRSRTGSYGLLVSWFIGSLLWLWRNRRVDPPDIMHVHLDGTIWPCLLVPILKAFGKGADVVITIHCSRIAVYKPKHISDRLLHPFVRKAEIMAVRAATRTVVLTKQTADALGKLRIANGKISVIPDCIGVDAFLAGMARHDLVDCLCGNHSGRPKIVLYVGRLSEEKGVHILPHVARECNAWKARLVLIGDGPIREELANLCRQGGGGEIRIAGFLPQSAVAYAMSVADLLIMPSDYEEFGGTVLESLSSGLPVIAFGVGGLKALLEELFPQGLVNPGDREGFLNRIKEMLLVSKEHHGEALDKAKQRIATRFGLGDVVAQWTNLYNGLKANEQT